MLYYLLMLKCTSNNCCAIKKIRDYYFCGLFGKCTCDVILSNKVFNITVLFASSVLSTYATLLGFHSREGCCKGGRKDGY